MHRSHPWDVGPLNAASITTYTIADLDWATFTTLPESHVSALLLGASALILDLTIRSRLVTYLNTPAPADPLCEWAEKMKEDFDLAVNRLYNYLPSG